MGDEEGLLFVIVGGTDLGHVSWSPKVTDQARAAGFTVNERGELVEIE